MLFSLFLVRMCSLEYSAAAAFDFSTQSKMFVVIIIHLTQFFSPLYRLVLIEENKFEREILFTLLKAHLNIFFFFLNNFNADIMIRTKERRDFHLSKTTAA